MIKLYGHLYEKADFANDKCAYCGGDYDHIDHCPPLAWAGCIDKDEFKKAGGEFLLLPSCCDCNLALSSKRLFYFEERISFLYRYYGKKVDKQKGYWKETELDEFGRGLRNQIKLKMQTQVRWIEKLRGVERELLKFGSNEM